MFTFEIFTLLRWFDYLHTKHMNAATRNNEWKERMKTK